MACSVFHERFPVSGLTSQHTPLAHSVQPYQPLCCLSSPSATGCLSSLCLKFSSLMEAWLTFTSLSLCSRQRGLRLSSSSVNILHSSLFPAFSLCFTSAESLQWAGLVSYQRWHSYPCSLTRSLSYPLAGINLSEAATLCSLFTAVSSVPKSDPLQAFRYLQNE